MGATSPGHFILIHLVFEFNTSPLLARNFCLFEKFVAVVRRSYAEGGITA